MDKEEKVDRLVLLIMILLYLFILSLITGCSKQIMPTFAPVNDIEQWNEIDRDLFNKLEDYRTSEGLKKVKPNKDLHDLSIERLNIMKLTGGVSHNGVGLMWEQLYDRGYSKPVEILAFKYTSNDSTIAAWIASEGHYRAITKEGHLYIGAHVLQYKGEMYYIVAFAR